MRANTEMSSTSLDARTTDAAMAAFIDSTEVSLPRTEMSGSHEQPRSQGGKREQCVPFTGTFTDLC